MFTGIIETTGKILERTKDSLTFAVPKNFATKLGDSLALNGVCLTAVKINGHNFTANIMAETWSRTNLGELKKDDLINLERARLIGDRFDGHIVQGHVDGIGLWQKVEDTKLGHKIFISLPHNLEKYVVEKGSISVDGISLTVIDKLPGVFSFATIPYTWEHTNLHTRRAGDKINLEVDIVAKYVESLLKKKTGNRSCLPK